MKKRGNTRNLIVVFTAIMIFLLQATETFAEPEVEVTDENVGEYSTRHPEAFGCSGVFRENETEEEKIARFKEEGEANNDLVNYYTIRYMDLTDNYPKDILNKKYQIMDDYIRWISRLSWNEDYSSEKSRLIYKIGVINTIETLDSGEVVFTLEDNPQKRFWIYSNNDWAYQRFISKPGDLVHLLTTVDRRVYHFDNWTLTRGLDISFDKLNEEHPEDNILTGFFPSVLYKERIEEFGVPNQAISLIIEYTDQWLEDYYGVSNSSNFQISSTYIWTDEEWERYWSYLNESCDDFVNDSRSCEDWACRDDLGVMGINVSSVKENIIFRKEFIRDFEILDDAIRFNTWESPTRWYYFSNEYDAKNYVDLFSKNQKVYIYYNEETREVYGMKIK